MPEWTQPVSTGKYTYVQYAIDPREKERKLIEASGSVEINGWSVTFYADEYRKFQAIASRPIKKRPDRFMNDNGLQIRLETSATIPKFIPIEKQKLGSHQTQTFVELDDSKDFIDEEFNEFQSGGEVYNRVYARSSIIKAYDFLKQYLPEFEDMIRDETVTGHAKKIVASAEKL